MLRLRPRQITVIFLSTFYTSDSLIKLNGGMGAVYVAASTDDKLIAKAKAAEPFGHIVKPLKEEELKITLEIGLYTAETEQGDKKCEIPIQ